MAAREAASSIPGVKFADDDMMNASLTIIFDDQKTDVDSIRRGMKKAEFPIEGDPEYQDR